MHPRLLLAFAAACLTGLLSASATPADRLRELDRARASGVISEQEYQRRWTEIITEGISGPVRPAPEIPARAHTAPRTRGRTELSLSGSWLDLDAGGVDVTAASGEFSLGHFVTPHLQLAVGGVALHAEIEDIDLTAYGAAVGADFHFAPDAPLSPYVGAGAQWVSAELEGVRDDDWAWNIRAGLKHYVRPNVAIKYQAQYQSFDRLDLDGFALTVGLVFVF